jgi:hypothetical protein
MLWTNPRHFKMIIRLTLVHEGNSFRTIKLKNKNKNIIINNNRHITLTPLSYLISFAPCVNTNLEKCIQRYKAYQKSNEDLISLLFEKIILHNENMFGL